MISLFTSDIRGRACRHGSSSEHLVENEPSLWWNLGRADDLKVGPAECNSLSKLGRNIRITRTNQHLRVRSTTSTLYIVLVFRLLTTALVGPCTLLKHPTSHALLTSPTPPQRGACTDTLLVGVSLVAPLNLLLKRSSLHCLGVCLTSCLWHIQVVVLFVTHKSMMTIPTPTVCYTIQVRPDPPLVLCTCCACFVNNMMMMYQQFPRIRYVRR